MNYPTMKDQTTKVVDLSQIINISAGDNLFIREMIDMYLNLLTKEMEKIFVAAEEGDLIVLKTLIHKIKPNLKIFGLSAMAEPLIEIETAAASGVHHPAMAEKISNVKVLNSLVVKELKEVRDNFNLEG